MSQSFACIQIEFGTPEFDEALRLRELVLRRPLNMSFEIDDIAKEYDSFHISCYHNTTSELLACLILKPIDTATIKMRQVAVHPDSQSIGVGSYLVSESEIFAKKSGYSKIELNARDTAVNFYKKAGYTVEGDVFKEVGIDHYFMWKNI